MSARRHFQRFLSDESGTTLVELAFVIALFLLIFFMLLDFGRMSYNWVMAEKAVQMAARMAAVRPPVCAGVPQTNIKESGSTVRYGTSCVDAPGSCVEPAIASCSGVAGNPTVDAIWARIGPLLPGDATPANLCFDYRYNYNDDDLDFVIGFLGGPYVPAVTVELFQQVKADDPDLDYDYCPGGQQLTFQFVSPLAGLAALAGAADTSDQQARETNGVPFPSMSVSLPGEDLALGDAG